MQTAGDVEGCGGGGDGGERSQGKDARAWAETGERVGMSRVDKFEGMMAVAK